MKRAILSALAVLVLVGMTGCCTHQGLCNSGRCQGPDGNCVDPCRPLCRACGGHGCALCRGRGRGDEASNPGPATGAVTYPYYTTRGPRDFLAKNPSSIGP
jgi:hypothetical protein